MPLAGKVRLNTFLGVVGGLLVGGALVGVVGFGLFTVVGGLFIAQVAPPPEPYLSGPSDAVMVAAPAPMAVQAVSGTVHDDLMRQYLGKDLGGPKLKDAPFSEPWKINVYQDEGKTSANRLKIDVDRDEKDDEKWDLSETPPLREVSTQDDGVYDQRFRWTGDHWENEAAAAAVPAPAGVTADPLATAAAPGRPVDQDLMTWRGKDLGSDKIKDATSGKPYKINLYQDAGEKTANRAKIDLDRDDKWDEKITFTTDAVKREVAPNDDENYTEKTVWSGSAWVPE